MMPRLLAPVLTVILLAAGFFAGVWFEKSRPLPPPPAPLMGEMAGSGLRLPPPPEHPGQHPPVNRQQLVAEIEKLRPQLEEFRQRMDQIDQDFDRDFQAILSPEQLGKQRAWQKRRDEHNAKFDPGAMTQLLTDDEIIHLQERPLIYMLSRVVIALRLEGFTRELKLSEPQQARTRALLRERRDKFIALIDSFPPPSLTLSRLAPVAQRLGSGAR